MFFSVSQKVNHLSHTLLWLYKIVGSPPPHLCQKIRLRHCGWIGRRWHQVAIHASVNPPTKINGKYSFWPILCNQAPNTQPCYIASVCGSLSLLFLEKNPDLFPWPKFCLCKVRTHATEISQLKLMGNLVFLCISKRKHLTHTLLYCIRSRGHPLPTCAIKSVSAIAAGLVVGDIR